MCEHLADTPSRRASSGDNIGPLRDLRSATRKQRWAPTGFRIGGRTPESDGIHCAIRCLPSIVAIVPMVVSDQHYGIPKAVDWPPQLTDHNSSNTCRKLSKYREQECRRMP
ncbi:unnamed protein product, partial [Sphacelaria rigidula]